MLRGSVRPHTVAGPAYPGHDTRGAHQGRGGVLLADAAGLITRRDREPATSAPTRADLHGGSALSLTPRPATGHRNPAPILRAAPAACCERARHPAGPTRSRTQYHSGGRTAAPTAKAEPPATRARPSAPRPTAQHEV